MVSSDSDVMTVVPACNSIFGKQDEAMQAFEIKRRVQRELEEGSAKFNRKPSEGLAYLVSI